MLIKIEAKGALELGPDSEVIRYLNSEMIEAVSLDYNKNKEVFTMDTSRFTSRFVEVEKIKNVKIGWGSLATMMAKADNHKLPTHSYFNVLIPFLKSTVFEQNTSLDPTPEVDEDIINKFSSPVVNLKRVSSLAIISTNMALILRIDWYSDIGNFRTEFEYLTDQVLELKDYTDCFLKAYTEDYDKLTIVKNR